jgi:hypothetical protein
MHSLKVKDVSVKLVQYVINIELSKDIGRIYKDADTRAFLLIETNFSIIVTPESISYSYF